MSSNAGNSVVPPLFQRLPTGSIKPAGWAMDQARVQADGLAGHLREFDSYVNGSIWVEGGSIEYSEMHEAAPYWFNSMVALAFQLEDPKLLDQVRTFLDWTLDHQQDDGWIGPELPDPDSPTPRLVWPRYLILLGLIQYAEADPTQTDRIVGAMHNFITLVNQIWTNNEEGSPQDGFQFDYQFVRWEEMIYALEWLYDNHPNGREDLLLETMQLVRDNGFSWKNDWFIPGIFPESAPASNQLSMHTHGVNTAQSLKSEALAYRFTSDPTDIQSTWDRIDMLYEFHGRASGTFSADEHLAGLDPSRGTELCTVVEQIFSLATVYEILGNNSVADRAEKIAYNALPAGIYYDWWSHQYDQEANQIWAQSMDPPPWVNNGPNSNVFGFEPNYPCCTVNHPSAYPKFWAHMFFTQDNSTLVHGLLGPATFEGTIGDNDIKVSVDSLYPFGTTLDYEISATKAFDFKIRIPSWAQQNQGNPSTISVNGTDAEPLQPNDTDLQVVKVPEGTTKIHLLLDAPLEIEQRFNGAIAVTRGALNFALEIPFNVTQTPGLRSAQALNDVRRLFPNAPQEYLTPTDNHTIDNTLLPTGDWQLAVDPDSIKIMDSSDTMTDLPRYMWAPDAAPISMTINACLIEWGIVNGTAAPPPQSPVACSGDLFEAKLVPFAAARLRLGEMPVMQK
ncbi:hypothetical protein VKT23_007874 [Stygiomarasmius scandens]|uniref:Uncharacterized protein n=1 Tax=Marasmiellus scandens TaxID=2682957 RepID=A0ABR1JIM7_9AGAR